MRRSLSPPMLIAIAALVIALGGDAIAGQVATIARKITSKDIKKGAVNSRTVKDGSLALKDFKSSERASLKGDKGEAGVAGPKGDTGARGLTGPQGETGTVDTSDFYDKTASDARFVRGTGQILVSRLVLNAGSNTDEALQVPGFGNLEAFCGTPAASSVQWRNTSSGAQDLWESFDGGASSHVTLAAAGAHTSASASGADAAARVEWDVGAGSAVANVIVDMLNTGTGGCQFQATATFGQGPG